MKKFFYVFQISRTVIFEVSYYLLGRNKAPYYATSASQFNKPKTDYNLCGQTQDELLKGFPLAHNFYKKYDHLHALDLSDEQHAKILIDIEKLKERYNFLYKEQTRDENNFSFDACKELSKTKI